MRPLVEPGPPLSPGDVERFSRHTLLPALGETAQRRLRNASVCVVGAGGLGSPVLLYLAAAGIGRLAVLDPDDVDLTNLQRQVVHGVADVGRRKVDSACETVRAIDPDITVEARGVRVTEENAPHLLAGYDVVVDGTDNFATRYAVNDACVALGVPLVWGSVLGFDAQVSLFWSSPSAGDPVDLRDLFPRPPGRGEVPSCAEAGVLGALCGQVGAIMATEVVKLVTGTGEPLLGRVLVLDGLSARTREVPLRRSTFPPPSRSSADAACAPRDAGDLAALGVDELAARLARPEPPALVDVREPGEHARGAIPGSHLAPLSDLRSGGGLAELPPGPVVLYCASGVRSAEAARLLRAAGRPVVGHLLGGFAAWQAATVEGFAS